MSTPETTPNYKKPRYWLVAAATLAALLALGQFFPEGSLAAQIIGWIQTLATALGVGAVALPTINKGTPTLLLLAALTLTALTLTALTGCSGMGMTPSRSTAVTQTLRFESCTVTFGEPASIAEHTYPRSMQFGVVDVQSTNEGSEATTATPTQTITPQTAIPVNLPGGKSSAAGNAPAAPTAAACPDGSCTIP